MDRPNTTRSRTTWGARTRFRKGFSIIETLIAMAVFAVGFVAVASIFPVSTVLQKRAVEQALAQQVARNVRAQIRGRKFLYTALTGQVKDRFNRSAPPAIANNLQVHPILQPSLDPPGLFQTSPKRIYERWQLNDRSYFPVWQNISGYYYPQQRAEAASPGNYAEEFNRSFYWVPLARRTQIPTSPSNWQIFVFILRGGEAHPVKGYDRVGTPSAFTGWANYDGFRSPKWHVPGVYSMPVTIDPLAPDRFRFQQKNKHGNVVGNRYGTEYTSGYVSSTSFEVQVGDHILDDNGIIHTVRLADAGGVNVNGPIPLSPTIPTVLWYGRPAWEGRPSPTELIIMISDSVQ